MCTFSGPGLTRELLMLGLWGKNVKEQTAVFAQCTWSVVTLGFSGEDQAEQGCRHYLSQT